MVDDGEMLELVRSIVTARQASSEQESAFARLLPNLLLRLEQYARRPFLPGDESDMIAVDVVSAIRAKNFENLRKFLRAHEDDGRSLERWLRTLCRWRVAERLDELIKSGLLANRADPEPLLANRAKSETLLKILEWSKQVRDDRLMKEALDSLDETQREALRLYWDHTSIAADGARQASARDAYSAIAKRFKLQTARDAERVVTTAKQRLTRALEALRNEETSDTP